MVAPWILLVTQTAEKHSLQNAEMFDQVSLQAGLCSVSLIGGSLAAVSTKEAALPDPESSVCLSICLCLQPPLHRAET